VHAPAPLRGSRRVEGRSLRRQFLLFGLDARANGRTAPSPGSISSRAAFRPMRPGSPAALYFRPRTAYE
jgi:hypothetical protein